MLAGSQPVKATGSAVSVEFTGLPGAISISGSPGRRAAALYSCTGQGLGAAWLRVCGIQNGLVQTHF